MEYQKTINLLHDTTNQPSKFRTRNWVELYMMNHEEHIIMKIIILTLNLNVNGKVKFM